MLPETLGKPLTNTMEEAEALGNEPKKSSVPDHKDAEDGLVLNQQEAKA